MNYIALLLFSCLATLAVGDDSSCSDGCRKLMEKMVSQDTKIPCDKIPVGCFDIKDQPKVYEECHYGANVTFDITYKKECEPHIPEHCLEELTRESQCRYCFQVDEKYYTCTNEEVECNPKSSDIKKRQIQVSCEVNAEVICKVPRTFQRKVNCSYTTGKSWSTALILSITLGGFGADRFYLGYWREGLGKLFSFGGLGVWTIVDIIFISVGYVSPADNSLYIVT